MTSAEAYARVIGEVDASVQSVLSSPADADERIPDGLNLAAFDAVIFTGSSLKIGERKPSVTRQIEFMKRALAAGLPVFGSCWGVHVATVACGGDVGPNDAAAEYAFARAISRTEAGQGHPLFAGRQHTWDAPAIHADVVLRPPPGSNVLAENALVAVQAIEIAAGPGTFWGTQYHPELDLIDLAAMLKSSADDIVATDQAPNVEWVKDYGSSIAALGKEPENEVLSTKLKLNPDVLMPARRRAEIANFLDFVMARSLKSGLQEAS